MENQGTAAVRVCLPFHLRNLAQVGPEVTVEAVRPVSVKSALDAVEARYPMLRGTIREYDTGKRRAFLRFFACAEDFSLEPMEAALPAAVAEGREPLLVVGAIAGGSGGGDVADRVGAEGAQPVQHDTAPDEKQVVP
jgi:sulfur-carrier protein